DDPAVAVHAARCQRLDRALEAVERVLRPIHHDLEGLVVVIPAGLTLCLSHDDTSQGQRREPARDAQPALKRARFIARCRREGSSMRRPLLEYDADCAFCRRWVARWRARTGDAVRYRPLRRRARAVQLIEPSGRRYQGAEAVFRVLARDPRMRLVSWLA